MSVGRKSTKYIAAALVVAAAIMAASVLYMGLPILSNQSSQAPGGQSVLSIRLTDPPQVPPLTSSLNMTYSSLSLLVGEPSGTPGQFNTKSVAVTPSGGSAMLDLLKLQNVSQTIATASLPSGSVLYSVTFTVTSIKIDVSNTISSVALATGGTAFTVTIARPSSFTSGDFALLQLNPVVVDTPSGYQLIPSSVGVMGHDNGEDYVGNKHQLTSEDDSALNSAQGSVSASLVALSVSGDVTSVTVQIINTGSSPMNLMGIGLHGNFTAQGTACQYVGQSAPSGQDGTTAQAGDQYCEVFAHMDEVVFIPVVPSGTTTTSTSATTSTTTASCSSGSMNLVNGIDNGEMPGLGLAPGQCVQLSFSGKLSFGMANFVVIPSTSSGQVYTLHVIGSDGTNALLNCTLPLGPSSCAALPQQQD